MSQISIVPSGNEPQPTRPLTFKEQLQRFENISRLNEQKEQKRSLARNQTLKNNLKKLSLDSRQILLNDMLQKRQTSLSAQSQRSAFQSTRTQKPFSELSPATEKLIESINRFSFDLYNLTCSNLNKNVVVSSIPLFTLLNIFHSADNGKTKNDILKSLGLSENADFFSGPNFEDLITILSQNFADNTKNKRLDHFVSKTNVFSRDNYLRDKDIQMLKENFEADLIEETDKLTETFTNLQRSIDVNIHSVENLQHLFMILTNSLDLKLDWKRPFQDMSEKGSFEKPDGALISINLMNIPKHRFLYCKNPCDLPVKLCEFPFANEDFAFTIILPEKNTIDRVEKELNAEMFDKITAKMKYVEVNSVLPRFTVEDRFDLVKFLNQIGAGSLTDIENKDYGLCVSELFYKSKISVQNMTVVVSTETNAVLTRDEALNVDCVDHPCEEFVCDNPFLFYVRNRHTKLILFMGKLVVPNVSSL
jgi:serine protease inhibitor